MIADLTCWWCGLLAFPANTMNNEQTEDSQTRKNLLRLGRTDSGMGRRARRGQGLARRARRGQGLATYW